MRHWTIFRVTPEGVREDFDNGEDFGAGPLEASGHDEADITGADDDGIFSGAIAFDIDETLGESGGEDAGGACAWDAEVAAVAFAAAHGENDGGCAQGEDAMIGAACEEEFFFLVRTDFHDGGVEEGVNIFGVSDTFGEAFGEFGAGEFFVKAVEAKAVVNALEEDAAEVAFAFGQGDVFSAFGNAQGRGHTGGAGADNDGVIVFFNHGVDSRPPKTRLIYRGRGGCLVRAW